MCPYQLLTNNYGSPEAYRQNIRTCDVLYHHSNPRELGAMGDASWRDHASGEDTMEASLIYLGDMNKRRMLLGHLMAIRATRPMRLAPASCSISASWNAQTPSKRATDTHQFPTPPITPGHPASGPCKDYACGTFVARICLCLDKLFVYRPPFAILFSQSTSP
jgi:hypothetical protein